jgi:hypothetical protein
MKSRFVVQRWRGNATNEPAPNNHLAMRCTARIYCQKWQSTVVWQLMTAMRKRRFYSGDELNKTRVQQQMLAAYIALHSARTWPGSEWDFERAVYAEQWPAHIWQTVYQSPRSSTQPRRDYRCPATHLDSITTWHQNRDEFLNASSALDKSERTRTVIPHNGKITAFPRHGSLAGLNNHHSSSSGWTLWDPPGP